MSEFSASPAEFGKASSYQAFVAKMSTQNLGEDWKNKLARNLRGEVIEALVDHGEGEVVSLFLPEKTMAGQDTGMDHKGVSEETRFAAADELGDVLWYTVDALRKTKGQEQVEIAEACHLALEEFGIDHQDYDLNLLSEIQRAAVDHAGAVACITKFGLIEGYRDVRSAPPEKLTSLPQNPFLHIMRVSARLGRALENGEMDVPPYASGANFENLADIATAAGQLILVVAWIASEKLGISLRAIAEFNTDKLENREINGKESDIHFDASYALR